MHSLKRHHIFLILSLLIAIINGLFVGLSYFQSKHNLQLEQQQKAINYFSSFDIAYQATQENMLQIANIIANTPTYQHLLLQGKQATELEGGGQGGLQSQRVRQKLHSAVSNTLQQLSEQSQIDQLHFHLGPDSTYFLRVHNPEKFGDNSDPSRHSLLDTNLLQLPIKGFEIGHIYAGIRGISPVSKLNTTGHIDYIGTVEAGVSFDLVLKNFTSKSHINAAVLLYEDRLRDTVWPEYLDHHLKVTPAISNLIIEQTTSPQITEILNINQATTKSSHNPPHQQVSEIQLKIIELQGHPYLYASKPLRDYLGSKDPNQPDAGQVVIWQDMSERYSIFNKQLNISILYAFIAFIIIELLLFFTIRTISSRLNTIIEHQRLELNSRNHVLEQLAQGSPLNSILESLIQIVEKELPSSYCSILLLDDEGKHLNLGAAPSLPKFYNEAIDGVEIGEGVGSCGTAAFSKKSVIVEDIQSHPYWQPYKELAAKAQLASCWSEPIMSYKGNVLGTFAIYRNIPSKPSTVDFKIIETISQLATIIIERKKIDEELQLLSRIYEQTHEGITITDTKGIIVDVNPTFTTITGYSRKDVIGKNPSMLSSGKHSPEFYTDMWNSILQSGYWQGEVWNRRKGGKVYAELLTISSIQNDDGNTTHYVGSFSDITVNKEQQKALELMAHYDLLTKLPNRSLFADRFNQAIAHSNRSKTILAVCFLDLDGFKPVNDNYGHNVGDLLLVQVSGRIKDNIRDEDTVSRQGGDEFTILLGNLDSPSLGERMLERLNISLAKPYLIDGHAITISASIGVALYPQDNVDLDTLLRHADQAMYQAKLAGKNKFQFFNAEQDLQVIQKQSQLTEIQNALDKDEFQLYYQPKVNMKTGVVFGAEALIRWIHPEKGLIPPLEFLPLIEGNQLEIHIGNWVIKQALQQLEDWQQQGIELEVSINISSHHLQSAHFVSHLDEALSFHPDIDSRSLQLEILESSALGDLSAVSSIIKTCQKALGVRVALDDFGTGYSSLTHLRNLSINTLKIDQTFVRDMLDDPSDFTIIDGIIGLANSFNREIIAEGVETTEHGLMLLIMGCQEAQGYGISRPIPAAKFPAWLDQYLPNQMWLSYGSKYHSMKESKIKLLRLTSQHWFDTFTHNYEMAEENNEFWTFISQKRCHHTAWIERAKKEHIFDEEWLTELTRVYDVMHGIANKLFSKYQESETPLLDEDFKELKAAFNKATLVLGQYE